MPGPREERAWAHEPLRSPISPRDRRRTAQGLRGAAGRSSDSRARAPAHLLAVASQAGAQCFLTAVVPVHRCGAVPDFHRVPSHAGHRSGRTGCGYQRSTAPRQRPQVHRRSVRLDRPGGRSTTATSAEASTRNADAHAVRDPVTPTQTATMTAVLRLEAEHRVTADPRGECHPEPVASRQWRTASTTSAATTPSRRAASPDVRGTAGARPTLETPVRRPREWRSYSGGGCSGTGTRPARPER
jgi:hypothetical protein